MACWPHYGPGNKDRTKFRHGVFFAYALDARALNHTTSEHVYHPHTFRQEHCQVYKDPPVGVEKLAFENGMTLADLETLKKQMDNPAVPLMFEFMKALN